MTMTENQVMATNALLAHVRHLAAEFELEACEVLEVITAVPYLIVSSSKDGIAYIEGEEEENDEDDDQD